MSANIADTSPTHFIEVEQIQFERAIAALRHWDEINFGHQTEKRASERFEYYGRPVLKVELPTKQEVEGYDQPQQISVRLWGRNLSCGGMSFLTAREIIPVLASDTTPIIRVEDDLLKISQELAIGLPRDQDECNTLWLGAKIARIRRLHDGLIECGVQFLRKMQSPWR